MNAPYTNISKMALDTGSTNALDTSCHHLDPSLLFQDVYASFERSNALGFSWPNASMIVDQVVSECQEVQEVLTHYQGSQRLLDELGDMLHAVLGLYHFLNVDPLDALSHAHHKYTHRLNALEDIAHNEGTDLRMQPITALKNMWARAKEYIENPEKGPQTQKTNF